ncbi:MAG: phosphoribosylamine--glycine ligase [Deltaproteobacteria bacterium]|nr:phosphoribosylamine--glycine ligase [Deltaproteobacteria bacterium]
MSQTEGGALRVAVLGKGAREAGLARRIAEEIGADAVVVVPGNAGTPGSTGPLGEGAALAAALRAREVGLVVIGPEALLAAGVADQLRAAGFAVVGPGAQGALLEGSKAYCKAFLLRHQIPTAAVVEVRSPADDAAAFATFPGPAVAKYDGLAEGKGVVVCDDPDQLRAALADLRARFGASAHVLIEERLTGPELSVFLLVADGAYVELPEARDHKRLLEGDQGPNTGGMGAISPVLAADDPLRARIRAEIIAPTVRGLAADGLPFRGFLFIGLMLTPAGPKVLEFNTRLGDPEAQVILPRIEGALVPLLAGCAQGALPVGAVRTSPRHVAGVVIARDGYPSAAIEAAPLLPTVSVRGAHLVVGSAVVDPAGVVRLPGGRALTAVGVGDSAAAARHRAYRLAGEVVEQAPAAFQLRPDVGRRPRLAVFASGGGSNLRAITAACAAGALRGLAEVGLVVSDRPRCGAVEWSRAAGLEVWAERRLPDAGAEWEAQAAAAVEAAGCDLVVLAGFMRVLGAAFVARFEGRIINIHPADTRQHQGLGGYEQAWERRLDETLITVHLVDGGLDTGPILAQAPVDLRGARSLDEVRTRGLAVEHALYPRTIERVLRSGSVGALTVGEE